VVGGGRGGRGGRPFTMVPSVGERDEGLGMRQMGLSRRRARVLAAILALIAAGDRSAWAQEGPAPPRAPSAAEEAMPRVPAATAPGPEPLDPRDLPPVFATPESLRESVTRGSDASA